ncbi:ORF40 [Cydia pomonella granulovirus]|uniref:ORF40 n=2 Tax=Cydia pomonella granulosis virus TaxID=28289 RepID=Q91F13_GVCPM|nr:ORF40 [Cydia pomonella granulovirus]AAK70700.1 ORF40 [Cydia pomonella granulovirus]AIU36686.1 ORF40 [Cydia pomonella granulovirus]AIU36828.1 ORF40 [Cydia pomonella granulovirus]AIU36965.1 ORF40 [Cydia pomonella granulovirus]AIU37107.1 ORF40 [Cydia pomonella granulovirus]
MSPKIMVCYIIESANERYIDSVLDSLSVVYAKYDGVHCYAVTVDCKQYSRLDRLMNQSFMMSQKHGSIRQVEGSGERMSFKSFAEAVQWINACDGIEYRSCFMDIQNLM